MAACVHIFGVVFYGFFASAEKQYWAEPHEDMIRLYDEDDGFEDRKAYENYGATSNEVNITLTPMLSGFVLRSWGWLLCIWKFLVVKLSLENNSN